MSRGFSDLTARGRGAYWISGDVGQRWSFPLLRTADPASGLQLWATGLGENEKDAMLEVEIDEGGRVDVKVVSLTGFPPPSLAEATPERILARKRREQAEFHAEPLAIYRVFFFFGMVAGILATIVILKLRQFLRWMGRLVGRN